MAGKELSADQGLRKNAVSTPDSSALTPPYFKLVARLIRPFPHFDFWFVKALRQRALESLGLRSGDRVLDASCGPGGCFTYMVKAVGDTGQVFRVEISPEVAINARKRIAAHKWRNVEVVVCDAETVALSGIFHGMVFFGDPDCYASSRILDNLLPHLADRGRVAIFGAKLSRHAIAEAFNPLFSKLFSCASFATTPPLEYEPWHVLEERLGKFKVKEYFYGLFFLASGPVQT